MAKDRTSPAKDRLVPLFKAWVRAFEETMCGLHDLVGEDAEPYVGREAGPSFLWRKPQSAKGCIHLKTSPAAKSWRWMADRVEELVSLQGKESHGACLHRKQLVVLLGRWKPQQEQRMTTAEEDEDGMSTARGKLQQDIEATLAAYRRWTRKVTPQCVDRSGWWIAEGHRLAERLDRVHWRHACKSWRACAADACEAGGKLAHRWTKPPVGIKLYSKALSPQGLVEDTLKEWRGIWGKQSVGQDWTTMQVDEPLPRPAPDAIRKAAWSFPADTALGGDFVHPKLIGYLDDDQLEVVADIIMLIEESGTTPVELLTLVFIDKPDGGKRPIGLLTGFMRLWGNVRSSFGRKWEADNDREYFWAGAGKPAADSSYQQALRAEVARAQHKEAASTLLDMVKCYEKIKHPIVAAAARKAGFPMRLVRVCLAIYAGPRILSIDGVVSDVFTIGTSIVAGCTFATRILRVVLIECMDMASRWYPRVRLYVYVDDIDIEAIGDEASVRNDIIGATRCVVLALEHKVEAEVSRTKSIIWASSSQFRQDTSRKIMAMIIEVGVTGKTLGTDFTLGGARDAPL